MIIRSDHMHEARQRVGGYCVRGLGAWFARHGLSLREFLTQGYPEETLAATGDQFALKLIEIAHDMDAK